ncbi:uncharacterized protein N7479_001113, partial [Penicillium vulpinum]|uniref:uncharacterized protein n=1 Tax=Penicillium vulpinum TaxID=29845 RepID=UPI002547FAB3
LPSHSGERPADVGKLYITGGEGHISGSEACRILRCRIVVQGILVNGLKTMRSSSEVIFLTNQKIKKHTTVRIRWWSPTQLLTHRRVA